MKVAMIVNGFPEISEKFLVNQVTGLLEAGAELDVYSALSPPPASAHELARRFRLIERTVYARTPRSTRARLLAAPALFVSCAARDLRGTIRALDFTRYATASRNLKCLYFLHAFGGRKYDLVHCHFGPNGLVGAFLKDAGITKRLIVSFHGSDINTYPKRYGEGVYRYLYEAADLVTVNSRFTAGKVAANGCPESKIEILPVPLRIEEHPEADPAGREGLKVLTVGRLVEKKGHRYAIEAFARAKRAFPEAEYLVVGDGPLRGDLEARAKELGVADSVRFLGAKGDREVAELYARASIFVLASVTARDGDMEGQGLVLQEAQASGLPVLSTLHNGIPDGVLDGVSGYLVPERDPDALAEKMIELLGDAKARARMGKAGREFVAARYDVGVLTGRLLEMYERARSAGEKGR
jgi:colanic acid/amylovoran biosynthesis glycosyltransferase